MTTGRNDRKKPSARLWIGAGAVSLGLHLALLMAASLSARGPAAPLTVPATPVEVTLFRPPPPEPPPPPPEEARDEAPAAGGGDPAPAPPAEPTPEPPRPAPRPARATTPPPPQVETVAAAPAPAPAPVWATVGEGRLAGAARAGSGGGAGGGAGAGQGSGAGDGAGCDMIGRIQQALRGDPEVRAAVAAASAAAGGRAMLVWDGDWVQTPGQAGKGLAGLRQAIALEVAFAPEACRRQPMRGLVLISFAGGERVVFGAADWRWSQLLGR